MAEERLREIRGWAWRFRRAIERCERRRLPVTFRDFPRGSCGDVTPILGTYLKESGLGSFDYVHGERPDSDKPGKGYSHAWLRQGDVIVDITADQFADSPGPVVVTRDPTWHSTFGGEVQHEADYRVFGEGFARRSLEDAYRVLKEIADA